MAPVVDIFYARGGVNAIGAIGARTKASDIEGATSSYRAGSSPYLDALAPAIMQACGERISVLTY